MILPLVAFLQITFGAALLPAEQSERRADLALRRAWDGKQLAFRFICGNRSRLTRLRELDDAFSQLQGNFVVVFHHAWTSENLEQEKPDFDQADNIGRRDDCRLRDSFEAGMADYQNGIFAARSALTMP